MHAGFLCGQAVINVLTIIMSRSKSKNVEIVPGFGEDCEPVTLLSMANRRTSAQWGLREMQPEEKIAIYNRKKSADGHLKMLNDQVYSGLLRFTYCPDGTNTFKSHDLHVTSEMTCGDVIPLLHRRLVPHQNGTADPAAGNSLGHISLMQGDLERVLEDSDKPLEIALDCSTKGLASPKFLFRPPTDHSSGNFASHRMRTSRFTSYLGALTTHSNPNLAASPPSFPTANHSPHLPIQLDHHCWLSTDGEQNSLYSADSCNSLSNGGHGMQKLQHMSKSVSALEPKSSPQRRKLVHMLSDNSEQNTSPPSTMRQLPPPSVDSHSPSNQGKMPRTMNSVGNFITRSLRVRKKIKTKGKLSKSSIDDGADGGSQGSLYVSPISPEEQEASTKVSNLVSPMLAERKLAMSTVMHIHYRDPTEALIYKSLLVSQKAKAREVVLQALKRFDMTAVDPKDFSLFVVVGRWQDVSQSVENEAGLGPGAALSLSNISILSSPRPAVTSIEEFIVCYSREIGSHECPYNLQFYFTIQEGYTRRFELRQRECRMQSRMKSRSHEALDTKENDRPRMLVESTPKRLSWASVEVFHNGNSPLFGDTSHHRRAKRHNRTSSSLSSAVLEGSETEEDILDEKRSRVRMVAVNGDGDEKVMGKVKWKLQAHTERLSVDEVDPYVVEVSTLESPHHRQPLHSTTSSSPDSGVVSFGKDMKKPRHDSADYSSTADQLEQHSNHLKSVSNTPTNSGASPSPAQLKTAFLLNLKLHSPEKELLVQPLDATTVHIMAGCDGVKPEDSSSIQLLCLHHPDLSQHTQPLCTIQQQTTPTNSSYSRDGVIIPASKVYTLHPMHRDIPVHLNGNSVAEPTPLSHGDLVSICNECYLFLFQDYASLAVQPSQRYSWRPHPLNHLMPTSPLLSTPLPSSPIIKELGPNERLVATEVEAGNSHETGVPQLLTEENLQPEEVFVTSAQLPPVHHSVSYTYHPESSQETVLAQASLGVPTELRCDAACQTPTPMQERRHTTSDEAHLEYKEERRVRPGSTNSLHRRRESGNPTKSVGYSSLKRVRKSSNRRYHLSSSSSSISSTKSTSSSPSRKSLFSFNLSEEEDLLRYLVSNLDVSKVSCSLGPALLLAMCTEYCHKCHGPAAASRFLQKAVDSLQEVVWDCTKKLTKWKPDQAMASRLLSHCKGLFPLLQPTVFWLANALELHHLLTHSCSPFTNQPVKQGENPANILHDILVYTFQQMFYTISKVLYYSLPLMLGCEGQGKGGKGRGGEGRGGEGRGGEGRGGEGRGGEGRGGEGRGGEDEIVEQAVDFLQALLDLMTDLHLHLEVVSCFYANLFFFINTTLLNSVMKLGPKRGLFSHTAGTTLRSSLTLLEGWACQVGFKDAVLHHLAKLSSVLDILATPPDQLVQLCWDELCDEYPVLHPAQLHHLLSHYTPPPTLSTPSHWAPSPTDTSPAYETTFVSESYDGHPGFTLPLDSYTLQLNKPPPQQAEFQALMEDLHASLKHNTKSVDVMPLVESAPSAQVPTLLTNITTPTSRHHHSHHQHNETIHVSGGDQQDETPHAGEDDDRITAQTRGTESVFSHSRSRECLRNKYHNVDNSGIGSNTESQEDLLDTHSRNCHNQQENDALVEKSNSGSKVADLIITYEESAKLSQSSSESPISSKVEMRGRTEVAERGKVGRVVSMMTEHSYAQPETLVLQEVDGCDDGMLEWEPSSYPDGAHLVNIQRGDKGFGVILVQQKDPVTGNAAIYVQRILPGSTGDQCKSLKVGDRVLAIDGQLLEGADYLIAEKYLKEAEDDVQLVLAPRPQTIHSQ